MRYHPLIGMWVLSLRVDAVFPRLRSEKWRERGLRVGAGVPADEKRGGGGGTGRAREWNARRN